MKCFNKFQDRTVKSSDSVFWDELCENDVQHMKTKPAVLLNWTLFLVPLRSVLRRWRSQTANTTRSSSGGSQSQPSTCRSWQTWVWLTVSRPIASKEKRSLHHRGVRRRRWGGGWGTGLSEQFMLFSFISRDSVRTFRRHGYSVDKEITTQI